MVGRSRMLLLGLMSTSLLLAPTSRAAVAADSPSLLEPVGFPLDSPDPPDASTWYRPLVPARLLDTRPTEPTVDGLGHPGTPLAGGSSLDLQVLGRGGVPATGVSAVVLNVTVSGATASSFLTVWPAGATRPEASNLNFVAGNVVPNLVVAKVGTAGNVSFYNHSGTVDVIADVAGYFPETDAFVPLVPARLLETRPGLPTIDGLGQTNGTFASGGVRNLHVLGRGGVPATGVDAVVLNVTVTNPTQPTFITVWPRGAERPVASNLNATAGQTVPNLVVAKVGLDGDVAIYNHAGAVDVVADVAGYFPTEGTYVPLQPARLLETRPGLPVTPGGDQRGMPIGSDQTYDLQVLGVGGVPDVGVSAVVLNVTSVGATAPSFLTLWPSGVARPNASNLNVVPGRDARPNLVVARVGAGGHVSIYNHAGQVDVVVDIAGYFVEEPAAVRDLVSSGDNTCVLDWLGRATCWGMTGDPEYLYPRDPFQSTAGPVRSPYPLATFDDIVGIAVGAGTCVLRTNGSVWCWAQSNFWGLTGDGSVDVRWPAVQVTGLEANTVEIDTGGGLTTCALGASGTVKCWGNDFFGHARPTPVPVEGLTDVVHVSVGTFTACAVTADGRVACWGRGVGGMLGNGSDQDSVTPVFVSGLTDADWVEVESGRTCAARVTGEAVCWGISFLGGGDTGSSMVPVSVIDGATDAPADDIWQIEGGADYGCALRLDDNVYCFGSDYFSILGITPPGGITTTLSTPVAGLPPINFISADYWHICAVTYESDVYCWGNNSTGQVGNGTLDPATSPTLVYSAFG